MVSEHYIYKITHVPTGRYYIGQKTRSDVPPELDGYWGSGTAWKQILNAHPENEFVKEILEDHISGGEINDLENKYVGDLYASDPLCINLCAGGGTVFGIRHSKETKNKISSKMTGEKHWNYGKHWNENIKQKIAESNKGKAAGDKNFFYGKPGWWATHKMPEEVKKKISRSHLGNKFASGNKNVQGKHWKLSEETKQKMREAAIKREKAFKEKGIKHKRDDSGRFCR